MKTRIVFLVCVLITAAVFGVFSFLSKTKKPSGGLPPTPVAPQVSVKHAEYFDPSGFKFNYPDTVRVSVADVKDETMYASVKMSSDKTPGGITLDAVSSNLTKVDDWFKTQVETKAIRLADLEARQFTQQNHTVTVALDKGVLFTITVNPENDPEFWDAVNDEVIASFAFVQPESSSTQNDTAASDSNSEVIFEGEEVIQ